MEKCDRCGCVGHDRRTLYMACFYQMDELPLPFRREMFLRADEDAHFVSCKEPTVLDLGAGRKLTLTAGKVTTDAELSPSELYTLRVCKPCRGMWMRAIESWFTTGEWLAEEVRKSTEEQYEDFSDDP